jgi:hypothetical protein
MYDAWTYYQANGVDINLRQKGVNDWIEIQSLSMDHYNYRDDSRFKLLQNAFYSMLNQNGYGTFIKNFNKTSKAQQPEDNTRPKLIIPNIVPFFGYELNPHSTKYNITEKWHPFGPSDCLVPGVIKKRRRHFRM